MADLDLVQQRADQVQAQLYALSENIEGSTWDLAHLLLEAKEGAYHKLWGFSRFGEWVENGSKLGLGQRQSYYLIGFAEKSRQLGLTKEVFRDIKISGLKEILSLDTTEHGTSIKGLLEAAPNMSLVEIKAAVASVKKGSLQGLESFVTIRFSEFERTQFDDGVERCRQIYGDTLDAVGEPGDISTGKAVGLICESFLQDPNNQACQVIEVEVEEIPF